MLYENVYSMTLEALGCQLLEWRDSQRQEDFYLWKASQVSEFRALRDGCDLCARGA